MKCEEISIPPYFRCPISLDLFEDPVTLWTGQTYDRSCIERWLAAGNSTCPVTMQKLVDSSMVPNHTLRHLIQEWLHSHGYSLDDWAHPVARIKQIIESDEFDSETKITALEDLHSLSQDLPHKNSCLISLGFFEILVFQIFKNVGRSGSLKHVEKALSSALNLMPFSELGCLNILKQDDNYAVMLSLLEESTVFIKNGLCLVIEAISREIKMKPLREKLGNSDRIVRAIVDMVRQRESEEAIRAVSALSLLESNRGNIVRHGAVEGLVACLSSAEAQRRSTAVGAIEKLVAERSGREAVVNHPWGLRGVVKMVFRVCEHEGSESAVNTLLVLCAESEGARERAIGEGVLTQLLLLLQSQTGSRTKAKARLLLKLLRSKSSVL
ncbi:U-box domain-containing protein 26-like [Salvia splendens]|nr:U-box domain-containing protein 26-like [Salvia splendens]